MNAKRLSITLPAQTKKTLKGYAKLNNVEPAIVVQDAITKMSKTSPAKTDITYAQGIDRMLITFSDTGLRLLELWAEQTGLTKSQLVSYALQKTIENEETEDAENE